MPYGCVRMTVFLRRQSDAKDFHCIIFVKQSLIKVIIFMLQVMLSQCASAYFSHGCAREGKSFCHIS